MNERTIENDSQKGRGQDILGLALAGLGAFFAVSILQAMWGNEPKFVLLARPVEGLMTVLGPWIGLFVSGATTAVGVVLFLSLEARPVGRQLIGVVAVSMGIAIALGGMIEDAGGAVGAILPSALGAVGGLIAGLAIGISVCLASIWVIWLGAVTHAGPKPVAGGGLMAPATPIDGVSPAEALALQTKTEPESEHAGGVFADIGAEGLVPAPVRALSPDEAIQPTVRQAQSKAVEQRARAVVTPTRPVESAGSHLAAPAQRPELPAQSARAHIEFVRKPAAPEPETGALNGLARAGLPENTVPSPTWETSDEGEPAEAEEGWEQVGLFDEEEEAPAALAATQPLAPAPEEEAFEEAESDEEQVEEAELEEEEEEEDEEEEDEEEDEEGEEEEYEEEEEEEAAELEDDEEAEEEEEEAEEEEAPVEGEYVIAPPEEAEEEEEEPAVTVGDGTSLLFQAGSLILEENRVAVSMVQRRFELDFDQACDILDRLQQEGLIGPYVGGRTREVLMSAAEWEEKAASISV